MRQTIFALLAAAAVITAGATRDGVRLGRLLRGLCRPLRNLLADLHLRTDLCLLGLRRLRLGL